ncbi:MAG: hypothetical protein ACK5P7_02705 [Bdellovibrio sp.]
MSEPKQPPVKRVDVIATARKLAQMMREKPAAIERDLINAGDELLAFFEDPNFRTSFQNLKALKKEAIEMAIQDISSGVMTLRSSSIGVSFRGSGLTPYITPHGTSPPGNVVFSISWKNIKAFRHWRDSEGSDDVTQDQINLSIYRLTAMLADLI